MKESTRIIPTCAGNTNYHLLAIQFLEDHPHLRGEYTLTLSSFLSLIGSSPPARGILGVRQKKRKTYGIIPTCAGNTIWQFGKHGCCKDHPHLRGEYIKNIFNVRDPLIYV